MEEEKTAEIVPENLPEEVLEETQEEKKSRKKRDFYVELALFLILGFLVGVAVKTEALKRITIGYNDYQMNIIPGDYDINQLETELSAKEQAQSQATQPSSDTSGTSSDGESQAAPAGDNASN